MKALRRHSMFHIGLLVAVMLVVFGNIPVSHAAVPMSFGISQLLLARVSIIGGTSTTAAIVLSAEAPSGGINVTLASSDPDHAAVPPLVAVSAGAKSRVRNPREPQAGSLIRG